MNDSYSKKAGHISKLASMPPEELSNHLVEQNPHLTGIAPGIAPHLYGIGSKAVQYLNAKMPKPVTEFPGQDPYEPTKLQKDAWLEKHETVNNPIGVLDHVKNGTLTNSHMEALQAVHPDLLNHMQEEVASNAEPKAMKKLHTATKISLSKFLGQPMSQNMMPGVVASNQAAFAASAQPAQAPQPGKKGKGSTQGGLAKLEVGKRAQTELSRDETGD